MPKFLSCEQRSPEWYAARAGIPTASEFSSLVTSTGERSKTLPRIAKTLAAERFSGQTMDAWDGNAWTERGKELEAEAMRLYEFAQDCIVEPVGFVTTDDGRAGCSPDGLVGADGLVEVKCLKAENHIEAILYHRKNGRCQPDYVQQTQGQLWICERQWCDLIFYHPVLPLLVIRQQPDGALISAIEQAVDAVSKERDAILATLHAMQSPLSVAAE
jgi:hypothetical protein